MQIALLITLLSADGCSRSAAPLPPRVQVQIPLEHATGVRAAVQQAVASPRALIFIHVPWAIMRPHSQQFANFANHWHNLHSDAPIQFHRIDFAAACEHYEPITELSGYSDWEKRAGHHLFGGSGSGSGSGSGNGNGNGEWRMANGDGRGSWVVHGKLVDIGAVWGDSDAELVTRTEAAFSVEPAMPH